jgi:hypothetical protein
MDLLAESPAVMDDVAPPMMEADAPARNSQAKWRWSKWILSGLLFALIVAMSIDYGLRLRRWAWDASVPIRFTVSVKNSIEWGRYTNQVGHLRIYDLLYAKYGPNGDYRGPADIALDYPPLRLLIIEKWTAWAAKHFPPPPGRPLVWHADYAFNRPMIELNTACELAGAVAMFLLVHYWLCECDRWRERSRQHLGESPGGDGSPRPFRGVWPALLAALLLWFSPAVIWNAHVYPQWDAWLLAPFLLAVYLGLRNLWLPAGIILGAVAMGKGQILLVVPVLALWQLMMLRPGAVVRLVIGLALGAAAVASPWLVPDREAVTWIVRVGLAMGLLIPLFFKRRWSRKAMIWQGVFIALAALMIFSWPWMVHPSRLGAGWAFLLVGCLAITARFLPVRSIISWFAGGITAALFLCVPIFGGSMAWYTIGIAFSTRHWKTLYWCNAFNLGAILQVRFHWRWAELIDLADYVPWLHPGHIMPMRYLMVAGYGITLVLCAIALTRHARRRDRRFLFAIVAPWVLMFALLPQMQDRYLMWGAAFSAAAAVISIDGFLLYLALTTINVLNTAENMLASLHPSPVRRQWLPIVGGFFPDLAWAVLLLAAIWLYCAFRSSPRRETNF